MQISFILCVSITSWDTVPLYVFICGWFIKAKEIEIYAMKTAIFSSVEQNLITFYLYPQPYFKRQSFQYKYIAHTKANNWCINK